MEAGTAGPGTIPGMACTVMVVEDDPTMRRRLAGAVSGNADLELRAAVGSVADARDALAGAFPDVLLVDLGLPDGSGLDLIRELRERGAPTRALVITVFGDERHVLSALAEGAAGYLLKDATPEDVGRAIADVRAGGAPISPRVARYLLKQLQAPAGAQPGEDGPHLTARETEVLQLIARGFSYDEIARLLEMSVNTVRSHIRSLYRKLEVSSRGEAVFEALGLGLLDERSD